MSLFQEIQSTKLIKYQEYYFNNTICGTYSGNISNELGFRNVLGITKKMHNDPPEWIVYINRGVFSTFIKIDITKKCYLKIRRKDYKQKLREKFEQTVLKIVLKKIVNEDFEWN